MSKTPEIIEIATADLRGATSWVIVTETMREKGKTLTVLPSDGSAAGRKLLRRGLRLLSEASHDD